MTTVAVTGARGRVGSVVTGRLAEAGYTVVGLDRVAGQQRHGSVSHVVTELDDPAALAASFADADAVIHLAAYMSWADDQSTLLFAANVQATFVVLEAMRLAGISRIVFASSGEVYPEGAPVRLPIDEAHPCLPRSHYGMNKLLGEEMCNFYERRYRFAKTIIRLPHTQDAAELLDETSPMSGPRFFLSRKIEQQKRFGNTEAVARLSELQSDDGDRLVLSCGEDGTPYCMPISDTRDTATGIVAALESARAIGETIGLAPPKAARFDEFIPLMSEVSGIPYVEVRLPGPAVAYTVDTRKAQGLLGFVPEHTLDSMVHEAEAARQARLISQ